LEQFLGGVVLHGVNSIRWLELRPVGESIQVWEFVAPDWGDQENLDFYEFLGSEEGTLATSLPSSAEALAYAHAQLGATPLRWLNQGVAQDEYRDFIVAGRPLAWPAVGG
jgi:hypothetical protein